MEAKGLITIKNSRIELTINERIGQLGPVLFRIDSDRPIAPYYKSHWSGKAANRDYPPHLVNLQGDFFCMPFGGNNKFLNHDYPCHGPAANGDWFLTKRNRDSLELQMSFPDTETKITKKISLGDDVIYQDHVIENCTENLPYGYHPILDCTNQLFLSLSSFHTGIVTRESDTPYSNGEYHALQGHARFSSIEKIPARQIEKPFEDCSIFPARQGYVDLIQMFYYPQDIAWCAASCPSGGYLWFSFKNPKTLPSTLFWMENRGRHFAPWDGINCCIGIEDVCSCFAEGASISSFENDLTRLGLPTAYQFQKGSLFSIRQIQGAIRIPKDFSKVIDINFCKPKNEATFIDINGQKITINVDLHFLDLEGN